MTAAVLTRTAASSYALRTIKDDRHRSARAAGDLANWLAHLRLEDKAPRTIDAYEQSAAFLLRAYPETAFREYTAAEVTVVLAGFPPKSRPVRRSQLEQWFVWGVRQGLIGRNPFDRVPKPRARPRDLKPVFSDVEVALLTGLPAPDGPLMAVLFYAGIRRSEAIGLQAKHVDFENRRLLIYQGKGRKDRAVPIGRLGQILADWFLLDALERDDYLWYTRPAGRRIRRDRPTSAESFGHVWWPRCLDAAGIDPGTGRAKRTPHSCRHTFATTWLRKSSNIHGLSRVLGHASIRTTVDTYGHLGLEDLAAELDLVEAGE